MFDHDAFLRAIGEHLRDYRQRKLQWTRAVQLRHMTTAICTTDTLAAYERGQRDMTLIRFVELCRAMGIQPSTLLANVEAEIFHGIAPQDVELNLRLVGRLPADPYGPLVTWAQAQLASSDASDVPTHTLPIDALGAMATLCGVTLDVLLAEIARVHGRQRRTP
jgi:hypothetical protein